MLRKYVILIALLCSQFLFCSEDLNPQEIIQNIREDNTLEEYSNFKEKIEHFFTQVKSNKNNYISRTYSRALIQIQMATQTLQQYNSATAIEKINDLENNFNQNNSNTAEASILLLSNVYFVLMRLDLTIDDF